MRPIAIVGPTATGKSDLAVEVALLLGRDVVNADAMQLYRGMDIGTAKLAPAERRGVPHHLLDVLDVTQTASVAAYQRDARAVIDAVDGGAVLVGGSGLYVSAVLDDLRFPGSDAAVRAALEAELAVVGVAALHERLAAVDPAAAAAILPSNGRRVVRALEVVTITGEPFSAFLPVTGPAWRDAAIVGLDLDTDMLDARIEDRVARMFAAGLVDEVRALLDRGLADGRTASTAIGYQQVAAVLRGESTVEDAARATAAATRRLVRRQRSWFRRDDRVAWHEPSAGLAARVADLVS